MATPIGDLVVRFGAQTAGYERGCARMRSQTQKWTSQIRGVSKNLGAYNNAIGKTALKTSALDKVTAGLGQQFMGLAAASMGVYAAMNLVRGAIMGVEKVNQELASSFAIMGNISDEMKDKLKNQAFDVAYSTKFGADEAAKSYFYLTSAGLDAQSSLMALPKVAKFAQAGNFDLARATDLLTDAQSALGMTVRGTAGDMEVARQNMDNMAKLADIFVKGNTLANSSVEQLSEAMTNKAAVGFRLLGKGAEEAVATLLVLADQGIKGADAGTMISRVLTGLKSNAINNAAAFERLGVYVYDANGEMRQMVDIVRNLEDKLGGLSDREKQAAIESMGFTKKTADAAAVLLGTSDALRSYQQQLFGAQGITDEVAGKSIPEFTKGVHQLTTAFAEFNQVLLESPLEEVGKWMQLVSGVRPSGGDITKGALGTAREAAGKTIAPIASIVFSAETKLRDVLLGIRDDFEKAATAEDDFRRAAEPIPGKATEIVSAFEGLPSALVESNRAWRAHQEAIRISIVGYETAEQKIQAMTTMFGSEKKALDWVAQAYAALRTPADEYAAAQAKVNMAVATGILSQQAAVRIMAEARKTYADALPETPAQAAGKDFVERAKEMQDRLWQLRTGATEAQAALRDFAQQPGATPEQVRQLGAMAYQFDRMTQQKTIRDRMQQMSDRLFKAKSGASEMQMMLREFARMPGVTDPQRRQMAAMAAQYDQTQKGKDGGGAREPGFAGALIKGSAEEYSARMATLLSGKDRREVKDSKNLALVSKSSERTARVLERAGRYPEEVVEIPV